MLRNALWLAFAGGLSFLLTMIFGWKRAKSFGLGWWDAEGMAIWMIVGVIIVIILLCLNKLKDI